MSVRLSITSNTQPNSENSTKKHTLYTALQTEFDKNPRSYSVNTEQMKIRLENTENSLVNSYNLSGNLQLECELPWNSETVFPNYLSVILSSGTQFTEEERLFKILTSWIGSSDMLTEFETSNKAGTNSATKNITNVNMKEEILKSNSEYIFKNWNIGRNWSTEDAEKIQNYYTSKFNALIDYIISNDLTVVDDTFLKLWLDMFTSVDNSNNEGLKRRIYTHSNGTLLLPSLVNWIANKKGSEADALAVCGYVPKGSMIFPVEDINKFDKTEVFFQNSGDFKGTYYKENIDENRHVPYNINGGLNNVGLVNYPFTSNDYNSVTKRAKTNSATVLKDVLNILPNDVLLNPNGTHKFNRDIFAWKDIVDTSYATMKGNYGTYKLVSETKIHRVNLPAQDFKDVKIPLIDFTTKNSGSFYSSCSDPLAGKDTIKSGEGIHCKTKQAPL